MVARRLVSLGQIELLVNHLMLQKQYPFKKTFRATLIANAFSYILGAVLIILLCI